MWWQEHWLVILISLLILPIVGTGVFARWLYKQQDINLETGTKCWEAFIKLVSIFSVIVSGAMLFGKYIDQQQQIQVEQSKKTNREHNLHIAEFLKHKLQFESEVHQRRRVLFDEARIVAARLAKMDQSSPEASTRFDELYLASLIGVEKLNGPVEFAMVQFEKKLRNKPDAPTDSLTQLALSLSRACEQELKESQDALLEQHKTIAELATSEARGD